VKRTGYGGIDDRQAPDTRLFLGSHPFVDIHDSGPKTSYELLLSSFVNWASMIQAKAK
jgi:hypothetical protein